MQGKNRLEIPCMQCTTRTQGSSLLPLPRPFVIAGQRFRECYYWDSCWIVKGLLACGMLESARCIVLNFVHLVHEHGFVPNGNRVRISNSIASPRRVDNVLAQCCQ